LGVLLLSQTPQSCLPQGLLAPDAQNGIIGENALVVEAGSSRTLTPEQLQAMLDANGAAGISIVVLNPVPGPAGPNGSAGAIGESGSPLVGEVRMWAGRIDRVPAGWIACDGRQLSRSDYAELFGVIGTMYGQGNGATTFDLPDFRNRSPMGADASASSGAPLTDVGGTPEQLGGSAMHVLSIDEMPAHTHTLSLVPQGLSRRSRQEAESAGRLEGGLRNTALEPVLVETHSTGRGLAHNNLHPYFAINYMIYAGTAAAYP